MKVIHGLVFKLKPNKYQQQRLSEFAGASRWTWNRALKKCEDYYGKTGKFPDPYSLSPLLPELKQQPDTSWLSGIHSQIPQQTLRDLHNAYRKFFNEESVGKPRFKKKFKNDSFRYPQGFKVEGNKVYMPSIGWVRFYKSREIDGAIKNVTVKKRASGWYVSFQVEMSIPDTEFRIPRQESSVGVDLGLRNYAALSTGEVIPNPRPLRTAERKLRRAQKDLSRGQKYSKNWRKAKKRVAKCHEDITNARGDFINKLTTWLTSEYDLVCVEDLFIKGMMKSNLAKSVGDASWGEAIRQIKYKADEVGVHLWQCDRWWPSTKCCSGCGETNEDLELKDEVFECPHCGLIIDRDLNAALNLVAAGLAETLKRLWRDGKTLQGSGLEAHDPVKQEPGLCPVSAS